MTEQSAMPAAAGDIDGLVKACEELRVADRALARAEEGMKRHVSQEVAAVPDDEDELEAMDTVPNQPVPSEALLEAQHSVRSALRKLGIEPDSGPARIQEWGVTDWGLDGLFELISYKTEITDFDTLRNAQAGVRELFNNIRASSPRVEIRVAELYHADDDEEEDPEKLAREASGIYPGVDGGGPGQLFWFFVIGGTLAVLAFLIYLWVG